MIKKWLLLGLFVAFVVALLVVRPFHYWGPPDPGEARAEAVKDMNLQCLQTHEVGKLQNLWIDGDSVLATWTCGQLYGEFAFKLGHGHTPSERNTMHLGPSNDMWYVSAGNLVRWVQIDSATAQRLIKLRDASLKH